MAYVQASQPALSTGYGVPPQGYAPVYPQGYPPQYAVQQPGMTQQSYVHTVEPESSTNEKWGYGIIIGIIVLVVVGLIIWWLVWLATRPSGRNDGETCENSDQCNGFCNGVFHCASGSPVANGNVCTSTSQCEAGSTCRPRTGNSLTVGTPGFCTPFP
jgi:hypothetical protein